jgi:hypothetical protein
VVILVLTFLFAGLPNADRLASLNIVGGDYLGFLSATSSSRLPRVIHSVTISYQVPPIYLNEDK